MCRLRQVGQASGGGGGLKSCQAALTDRSAPPAPCPAGLGLETVLPAVVARIPPPTGDPAADLRMLLFDAYHDEYR